MKYGELIQFDPIETVIQIRDANDAGKAAKLIQSYVMSDDMAEMINQKILSELKLDEVIDNKGVLLVGNYGTGKSHLMSVISGVAEDKDNLQYLRNKAFAGYMEPLAGRFEVLRIEIGAVRTYLRDIILGELEKDLARRGINYKFPSADKITGNKDALNEMMLLFEQKYGQKGYLLVIDELLDYLKSRTEMDLMLELGFLRELGEFIKNSRFRVICGVQEALFDNPSFTFVANTLLKVKDRFEQAIIRREDIAYVVSERILKKNPEQKAKIREHLIKFCPLYQNMNERLEEFVELFPIHPAYIETFQRVYLAEKREVLKTISATVKSIVKEEVPKDQPGVKSYDTYWKYIKENMAKKVEPEIKEVLEKSSVLEDIINRSFTKPAYKPLALQAIYALSVHRLTTGSLDVKAGLTAQNLKDDLLLFIETPVKEEEFLLTTVQTVMRAIMETVSGQFIEYNKDNEQYYLDLTKIIDYDAKIEQKANVLHESQLNTYFYALIYELLDWETAEYVTGHKIYEYFLNWDEKSIFRQGYLFMGESNERPTAQPPRDFYVYFLPPYGILTAKDEAKEDEVYYQFKGDEEFKHNLKMYAAALEMAALAAQGDTKRVYTKKADDYKKVLASWINKNKLTGFQVIYQGSTRQLPEVLHGKKLTDRNFKEIIDLASSTSLSSYFLKKYPKYPKFLVKITHHNQIEVMRRGLEYIAGKPISDGANLLESFGLLRGNKIKPENSPYGAYFIKKINSLPANQVLNFSDLIENPYEDVFYDKEFKLDPHWLLIIFGALIYSGHLTLLAGNNVRYDASNLEALAKENTAYLYHFKHIAKPKAAALVELKKLFSILNIPEGLIVNPNTWEDAVKELLKESHALAVRALHAQSLLNDSFALWGELLIPLNLMEDYKGKVRFLIDMGNAIGSRFNTPAKLQNFDYTLEQLAEAEESLAVLQVIERLEELKSKCSAYIEYFSKAELIIQDERWQERLKEEKEAFILAREASRDLSDQTDYAARINHRLTSLKDEYISYYLGEHNRSRLGVSDSFRKGAILEGQTMANLRKLTGIAGILSVGKFTELSDSLAKLKVCYELSPAELKQSHICPHCHFKPADQEKSVKGLLDLLEDKLDNLLEEWVQTILSSIEDPLVKKDIPYLKPDQKKVIESFLAVRNLPPIVDNNFVEAVNTLLQGLEKIEIDIHNLADILTAWGPSSTDDLKEKFNQLVRDWTRGKDQSKVRIIIKK